MTLELHTTESLHDPISTPSSGVESFSQIQIKTIQDKIPNLTTEQIKLSKKHLDEIEKTTTQADQTHIREVMRQLLQIITPSEALETPTIIQNIRRISKNISTTHKDILWCANSVLGRTKTELAQGSGKELSEEEKLDQQLADAQQALQTVDNSINNKKQTVETKQQVDQQLDKTVETKQQVDQQLDKALSLWMKTHEDIINTTTQSYNIIKNQYLPVAKQDKQFPNNLDVKNFSLPSTELWQELTFDKLQQILGIQDPSELENFIRYQAYLRSKPEQSRTAEENEQVRWFSSLLASAGIDDSQFFAWLKDTELAPRLRTSEIAPETTLQTPSLDNLSSQPSLTSSLPDSSLRDQAEYKDEALIQAFSWPLEMDHNETKVRLSLNNPDLWKTINDILEQPFPLISHLPEDRRMDAKRLLLVYRIGKHNPDQPVPDTVLQEIYKDQPLPPQADTWRRQGISERYTQKIENKTIWPLMKSQFTNKDINKALNENLKSTYMDTISEMLRSTPSLSQYHIDLSKCQIKDGKISIPLYLDGDKRPDTTLRIQDGIVSIKHSLYNPSESNSENQISWWWVEVGAMPSYKTFREDALSQIPPISEAVNTDRPRQTFINNALSSIQSKKEYYLTDDQYRDTPAGIAHMLSANTAAHASLLTLITANQVGKPIDQFNKNNIPLDSPLYAAGTEFSRTDLLQASQYPKEFHIANILRNTTTHNGAQENDKLSTTMQWLTRLLTNEETQRQIHTAKELLKSDYYNLDTNQLQNYLILSALDNTDKKPDETLESLSLLFDAYSTHPENPKINHLNGDMLGSLIDTFTKNTEKGAINFENIPINKQIHTTFKSQYALSDKQDQEFLNDKFKDIGTEKIETILA